jgi:SPP1 family predicted phage head-tail adaptor
VGFVSVRKFILTVEQDVIGNEYEGEPATTPETVCSVWGNIQPLTGREYQQAQQMQSNVSHKITTELLPQNLGPATSRMRLKHGTRTFEVQSVVNVEERNRELEWMCTELV